MSQMQRVNHHGVYKGKRSMRANEIETLYGISRHISYGDLTDQMRPLNDLFAMAEGIYLLVYCSSRILWCELCLSAFARLFNC